MHASTYMSLKKRGDYLVSLRGPVETKEGEWGGGGGGGGGRDDLDSGGGGGGDGTDEYLQPCNFGKFGTFEITRKYQGQRPWSSAEGRGGGGSLPPLHGQVQWVGGTLSMADAKVRSVSESIPQSQNRYWSSSGSGFDQTVPRQVPVPVPRPGQGQVQGQGQASVGPARCGIREERAEASEDRAGGEGGSGQAATMMRGGGEGGVQGGMDDDIMYDSVGEAVTAMEREGKEDLLHACMAQAEYDKKGAL
ncbi:hypothetical protein EGW08_018682 [Elysia chlorotica]|uniref:Uncharacterized protein n=1 Tax=Elysia chlorotica TaxID=188477 RepID=A0A3S1B6X7_ELYCH|nr:hypothetical protein EGW08_018682 [Elysia chlorotica]